MLESMSGQPIKSEQVREIKGSNRLIFFLCPFNTTIKQMQPALRQLKNNGYSVIAYDFNNDVWLAGKPENIEVLVEAALQSVLDHIVHYKRLGVKEFGIVGSSMGAFTCYNLLGIVEDLSWGVLIAGGYSANTIWRMDVARKAFETEGHTLNYMHERWQQITHPVLTYVKGKNILMTSSARDELVSIDEVQPVRDRLVEAGADVHLILHRFTNHKYTIIRDMINISRLVKKVVP